MYYRMWFIARDIRTFAHLTNWLNTRSLPRLWRRGVFGRKNLLLSLKVWRPYVKAVQLRWDSYSS